MQSETLHFEIYLVSESWHLLPHLEIFVNETQCYSDHVHKGSHKITFTHVCDLDNIHKLLIKRSGKDNSQYKVDDQGTVFDQYVDIEKIVINGVNCRKHDNNILARNSFFVPEYPEPWASQQQAAGKILEKNIKGATRLSHNGTWYLDFSCPFDQFVSQGHAQ